MTDLVVYICVSSPIFGSCVRFAW